MSVPIMLFVLSRRFRHRTSLLVHALAAPAVARGTSVSFSTSTSAVGVTVN